MKSFSPTHAIRSIQLALLLLAFGHLAAHAGMMSPCVSPTVLPTPAVHVFLLPYKADKPLTAQGQELTTILQRHVLYTALKYQSIAVEQLTGGDDPLCDHDHVAMRVLPKLKHGQVAIFLWGRLFERAGDLHVQSTVAYNWSGRTDTITWDLNGSPAKSTATLPDDPIIFAPRKIPLDLLSGLQTAEQEASRVHRTADAASPYDILPSGPQAHFGFEVLGTEGDWMHVHIFPSGEQGWLSAHALASGDRLKGTFPELYFVDGLIGYNELSVNKVTADLPPAQAVLAGTLQSLDRYMELSSSRAESDARAIAAVLTGNARWRAAGDKMHDLAALESADQSYRNAERIAPTSTIANNFHLACALALCSYGHCEGGPDALHAQFLAAIARDPTSRALLNNLDALYQTASRGQLKLNLSEADISRQQSIVKQAANALPTAN
jgi:hypothetical protein